MADGTELAVLDSVKDDTKDAPIVVLLHGFPECAYGWRHQIGPLVDAGFRVLTPDQRGYGYSDVPNDVKAYRLDVLAQDVLTLIDDTGAERAHVVGHDWGAVVTWWLGMHHASRINSLVTLNVPHPTVFLDTLKSSLSQLSKSWYMFMFQLPFLPERAILKSGGDILRRTSRRGSFTDDDLATYVHHWRRPGVASGMLNWYRASFRSLPLSKTPRVTSPMMLIWGKRDHALSYTMAQPSIDLCDDGRLELIDHATHWVQHDAKDDVTRLLLDFLRNDGTLSV